MKKIIYFLVFLIIAGSIYYIYKTYGPQKEPNIKNEITVQNDFGTINKLYIYGNHLNIYGSLNLNDMEYKNIELVIYNNTDKPINCIFNKDEQNKNISFNISDLLNDGLYLDDIEKGTNSLLIKVEYEKDGNIITNYYPLKNETEYNNLTYYTLSKYNNKIIINSENDQNTLSLNVAENTEDIAYDIVLDPGHGGRDPGASNRDNTVEKTITLEISKILKEKLENMGLKVKMTREDDTYLEKYADNGRIDNMVSSHAKYGLSIHLNSHESKKMHGVELYTANNIDYTFARNIVDTIVNETKIDYSNNMGFKKYNGVYTRQFTKSEINNSTEKYPLKTTNSAYYFIIRETGGIITGAYVDGSIDANNYNKHYNSPIGIETYIIELGYIINDDDLNLIKNNKEKFATALADSIKKEIN